jgi:excisionase family DNA binding protein
MAAAKKSDGPESMLLTYQEARARIGVSLSKLYRLMRQGEIRNLDLGPQTKRISQAECERYVRELERDQYGDPAQPGRDGDRSAA